MGNFAGGRWLWSSAGYTNGEYAQWDNLNLQLDSSKYYYLFLYQDWKSKGTNYDSYKNGGIGSIGDTNSYDDVGDLQDISFIIWGAE